MSRENQTLEFAPYSFRDAFSSLQATVEALRGGGKIATPEAASVIAACFSLVDPMILTGMPRTVVSIRVALESG
ncbi:MAG: hypothetical protein PVF54_05345 [Anaerolineae bacterium]